jgi:hypothetical protein
VHLSAARSSLAERPDVPAAARPAARVSARVHCSVARGGARRARPAARLLPARRTRDRRCSRYPGRRWPCQRARRAHGPPQARSAPQAKGPAAGAGVRGRSPRDIPPAFHVTRSCRAVPSRSAGARPAAGEKRAAGERARRRRGGSGAEPPRHPSRLPCDSPCRPKPVGAVRPAAGEEPAAGERARRLGLGFRFRFWV